MVIDFASTVASFVFIVFALFTTPVDGHSAESCAERQKQHSFQLHRVSRSDRHNDGWSCQCTLRFCSQSFVYSPLRRTLSIEKNALMKKARNQTSLSQHVCQMKFVHQRLKRTSLPMQNEHRLRPHVTTQNTLMSQHEPFHPGTTDADTPTATKLPDQRCMCTRDTSWYCWCWYVMRSMTLFVSTYVFTLGLVQPDNWAL